MLALAGRTSPSEPVLGQPFVASRSVFSGIGGFEGRALHAGEHAASCVKREPRRRRSDARRIADTRQTARSAVLLGCPSRRLLVTEEVLSRAFFANTYSVSQQADRMGYRLNGPAIPHRDGFNIVSDGIVTGSVQIPGSGEPIVLMTDRQTTGGYPKIATIITADLARFAQKRPGEPVRFTAVSREDAIAAARSRALMLEALREQLMPAGALDLSSTRLLGLNLVGGMVDANADFFLQEGS